MPIWDRTYEKDYQAPGKVLLKEPGVIHALPAFGFALLLQFANLNQVPVNSLFIKAQEVEFARAIDKRLGIVQSVSDVAVMTATAEREDVILDRVPIALRSAFRAGSWLSKDCKKPRELRDLRREAGLSGHQGRVLTLASVE